MNEDVIDKAWPYDGPHSTESVISAAEAIADLVRYMNNATRTPGRLPYAGDVYTVLGHLTTMTRRLPQLVTQLKAATDQHWDSTTVYDTEGGCPQDLLGDCSAGFDALSASIADLTNGLADVHAMIGQVGHE